MEYYSFTAAFLSVDSDLIAYCRLNVPATLILIQLAEAVHHLMAKAEIDKNHLVMLDLDFIPLDRSTIIITNFNFDPTGLNSVSVD